MRHRRPGPAARHRARTAEEGSLTEPVFVGSFPQADVSLDPPLPEVVLVGRSNVGKSSLLNALVGRRIAKVSATPGKTRMLNVFRVQMPLVRRAQYAVTDGATRTSEPPEKQPRTAHRALYLLDLPGYGYARAPQSERAKFRGLIRHTIDRPRLAGVVWLLDIRREPSPEDQAIHEVFATAGTPVLAALTKSDTLSRLRRLERARVLGAAVELPADQVILTSARTKDGLPELREAIAALVSALAA